MWNYEQQILRLSCQLYTDKMSECLVDGATYNTTNNTMKFHASMLSIDRTPAIFYFYAQIASDDGQNVVQFVPVTVKRGDQPVISIRCIANCPSSSNLRINISQLLLAADCINCATDERLFYSWTIDIVNTSSRAALPLVRRGKQFAVDVRSLSRSKAFHTVRVTGL